MPFPRLDASSAVHSRSPSRSLPDAVIRAFSSSLTTTVFSQRSMRRFDTSPAGRHRRARPSSPAQHRDRSLSYQATSRVRGTPHLPNVISCTPILRATSTTGRPPSITKATASALYSSVKLRRVDPTIHTPLTKGSYIACPENRGRSRMRASLGFVHMRNRIEVLRAIRADEPLDLEVWTERFATHRSGATVDLCATVAADGTEVWRSRSTYLSGGATAPEGAPEADVGVAVGDLDRVAATWRIPADAGRRYAKASGDVNPIHLSGLTAKVFGFKRAIAHGMWVKARVLGALSGRLPDDLSLDVSFRKPLLLPSTVTLSTAQAGGGWDFAVRNATTDTEHVVGTIRPL